MTTPTFEPSALPGLLETDKTGAICNAAVTEIKALADDVKKTIDAGLAPAEYEKMNKIYVGLATSAAVVVSTWQGLQAED